MTAKKPEPTEFGALLDCYRARAGLLRTEVARRANVDHSYVVRLCQWERGAPSRALVGALAHVLRLSRVEEAQLYVAAGYAPPILGQLGWSTSLDLVVQALARLPVDEQDRLGVVLAPGCTPWPHVVTPVGRSGSGGGNGCRSGSGR